MGNREDLLAGTRKVILERGVAKTTARDIAAASGVSLAAIGYHFGSKDRLISEALVESLGTGIGDELEDLVGEHHDLPLIDAFADTWNRMPEIFAANREALLASLENALLALRDPASGGPLRDAVAEGHRGMAERLRQAHPELDEAAADAVARLDFVLAQSLGLLWLLAPDALPTGDELARAVAVVAGQGEPR
ncbi:TetR/AcrR family transcriptional regulator [Agromyces archimandritae]|uniref:TetR/AcrR family transcriptional regulator n=1 Tax=Agromyces archimandritae TaxID=2781962 RepID=A0A975FNQ5_9MICO|nr:TetR/AcrR family transcriptional regulator [Agromyces archimandritae]QTX04381.1 TetR/AcrR family transcriptional regulator [Agromyces archimandritae]